MSLPKFSVKQPVFTNMLMLLVFISGIYYYNTMPREMLPLISTNIITITTVYPGATPEEVENLITAPIEEEINGVDGIDKITSVSLEGVSSINVEVRDGYDVYKVLQDIKAEVDKVNLPSDVEDNPEVRELKVEFPVCTVCVSGNLPEKTLRIWAKRLKNYLKNIPGVSTINMIGYRDREIWVEVDRDKLIENRINFSQISSAIRRKNINFPGGKLKTKNREYLIRTVGEIKNPREINQIVLKTFNNIPTLYVKDVASVKDGFKERKAISKINGLMSINLDIQKRHDGDTIQIVNLVKKAIKHLKESGKDVPPALQLTVINDRSVYIKDRIKLMRDNGINGLLLVLLSLYLMLNFKMAVMTALGIPFAFFGTFVLMKFLGISINMISLFGMIVVLGMIVDDAIVICENFFRYLEEGYSPKEAAILGTEEVMWPVISAVATTIAAFLPLAMMTGMMGKFMRNIPAVVIMALICSLIEALIILPSHLADFVKPLKINRGGGENKKLRRWYDPFFDVYEKSMFYVLKYRYLVLAILIIVAGYTLFLTTRMRFILINKVDIGIFRVKLEVPVGYSLYDTEKQVAKVEKKLLKEYGKYIKVLTTRIGLYYSGRKIERGDYKASLVVEMDQDKLKSAGLDTLKIVDKIKMDESLKTGFTYFEVTMARGGPPVGKAISYEIKGENLMVLHELAQKVKKFLSKIDGVTDLTDNFPEGKDEVVIKLDENRAKSLGIDVSILAAAVRTAINGEIVSTIRKNDEDISIRVILAEKWRENLDDLKKIPFITNKGQVVMLSDIATIKVKRGFLKISRENQERTVVVQGDVIYKKITPLQVKRIFKNALPRLFAKYPGYRVDFGGEIEDTKKSLLSLLYSLGISVLLIYLILGTQFASFVHPLTVMVTVPFGFIGVIWGFYITGKSLGLLAMIGLVALSGIVVNDSLVLIDFIIRLREKRKKDDIKRVVTYAGRMRIRPIILTSVTTIFGLLPMCFATSGQASFLSPMAQSLSWGLTFSTILTLVVIPCIYLIMEDIQCFLRRMKKRFFFWAN